MTRTARRSCCKAATEGITPEALIERVGTERRSDYAAFNIGFDNYYTTHSEENRRLTVRMYEALVKAGHITRRSVRQAFDEKAGMFLPDRYVKGTCPRCATPDQYGDSCENCGATYSPSDLIDPVSVVSGTRPVRARVGAHLLPARQLRADAAAMDALRTRCSPPSPTSSTNGSTRGCATGTSRATRRTSASRFPDAPGKYFYVWLDAPVGYMASFENYCTPQRARLRGLVEAGQRRPSCITSSARTSCISTRCSGRRCSRARDSASRRRCTSTDS